MKPTLSNSDRTPAAVASAESRAAGLSRFINQNAVLLWALAAAMCIWLNWWARSQQGMIPCFYDFRDVIRAGFDPHAAVRRGVPTFPMWGYGWLLLLTTNKLVLLLLQNVLAVLSFWIFVRAIEAERLLGSGGLAALRVMLVFTLPFYAVTWPAAVSTSLITMSVAFTRTLPNAGGGRLLLAAGAGVLLGLAANFRSDALLIGLVLAPILLIAGHLRARVWLRVGLWLVCAYGLMLPWAAYTRSVVGRPLLTSTNSGLTSLAGFGHVPDNRWGITISDEDPVIANMIVASLGHAASPVSYEADCVLKQEFRRLVQADPREYLRKVLHTTWRHVRRGAYAGEFVRRVATSGADPDEYYFATRSELVRHPWQVLSANPLGVLLVVLQVGCSLVGKVVVLVSFLSLPIIAVWALARRRTLLFCFIAVIVYSAAVVGLLALADSRFASHVYAFHLLNILVAAGLLRNWLGRVWGGRASPRSMSMPS